MNLLEEITAQETYQKDTENCLYSVFKAFIEHMPEDSPAGIQVKQDLINHFLKDREK